MASENVRDDIAAIIDNEVAAIEADRDAPFDVSTKMSRGNGRSKVLQVRLNPEELSELESMAEERGLPTSTVAREAILRLISPDVARTAAANRLIEEFTRYVATLNASPE